MSTGSNLFIDCALAKFSVAVMSHRTAQNANLQSIVTGHLQSIVIEFRVATIQHETIHSCDCKIEYLGGSHEKDMQELFDADCGNSGIGR